jgi:hypothetical protein
MTVQGLEEGLAMLRRLPPDEILILMELPETGERPEYGMIQPPPEVITVIEDLCKQIGLQLIPLNK